MAPVLSSSRSVLAAGCIFLMADLAVAASGSRRRRALTTTTGKSTEPQVPTETMTMTTTGLTTTTTGPTLHAGDNETMPLTTTTGPTTEPTPINLCSFDTEPKTLYAWDPKCNVKDGDHTGCKADGVHMECRFCGEGDFPPCPVCEFEAEPKTQYVWDSQCKPGKYTKGCFADGIHFECRFCGDDTMDPCPTTVTTTSSLTRTHTTSTLTTATTTSFRTTSATAHHPRNHSPSLIAYDLPEAATTTELPSSEDFHSVASPLLPSVFFSIATSSMVLVSMWQ